MISLSYRVITVGAILLLAPRVSFARFDVQECEPRLMQRPERITSESAHSLATKPSINLKVQVGQEESLFYRGGTDGLTSVQVRAVSGSRPLVGGYFPAGNSGAIMMLSSKVKEPKLEIGENSFPVQVEAARGITSRIKASNLPIEDGKRVLRIESLCLGNVRFLRDHVVADHGTWVEYGMKPEEINETSILLPDGDLLAYRTSLSGKAQYTLRVHPTNGAFIEKRGDNWVIVGGTEDHIQFEITPTSSEPPRVGVPIERLVEPAYLARMTEEEKQLLSYLFFEDGAVAGAHAYTTYFGRDPLITAMIAQDAFTPFALKLLIGAALDTADAYGNIAHEPTQGERAAYERKKRGEKPVNGFYDDTVIYDREMVDTQFLVMPVVELLLKKTSVHEVQEFLAQKSRNALGKTYGELLTLNKDRIVEKARPFAEAEMARPGKIPAKENYIHLIRLLGTRTTGNWRDSDKGLALGKYAFDINTTLVPAALKAIMNLRALGLDGWSKDEGVKVQAFYEQWRVKPFHYYLTEIPHAKASADAEAYARSLGLTLPTVDPLQGKPLRFFAIALDDSGYAIPVMHSDVALTMLYTDPIEEYLPLLTLPLRLPYPYGLDSPAGMFIASAAYAGDMIQKWFMPTAYHAGPWSFMQEAETRGLKRQRERTDLSVSTQRALKLTHFHVWRAIQRNADWRGVELWSARVVAGVLQRMGFGTGKNITAESCLDQFWSVSKMGNFEPDGWSAIPLAVRARFMTWDWTAPLPGS